MSKSSVQATDPPATWAGRIAVDYLRPEDLHPDLRNPRRHSKKQLRQIADSIRTFGFIVPVLVDDALTVVAGHGRLLAAQELGLTKIPSIRLGHLTPAQLTAFMIADNRLTEIAVWDDRLLAEQMKALSALKLEFSLDVTGFEMGEIDLMIEGLEQGADDIDPADQLPNADPGPTISQLGDLWLLGHHRLLCGSALDGTAFEVLMAGETAAMVFTDPPFNLKVANITGLGAIQHPEFVMASGEMSKEQFTAFLGQALGHLAHHSAAGAVQFVCMDWRHLRELLSAARPITELLNLCVWVKDNGGMGSLYRSQHELVAVFKSGHEPHRNNVQLGRFGRNRTNVWHYPGVNSFGRTTEEGNLLALHPTVKPVALVADAILDVSARGDIVLDAFLGSGTTIAACQRTGRRGFGLELDPCYVDTAIRRWQTLTGEAAVHAETEHTFDQIAKERGHAQDQ